jgi:hypothetical protein
MGKTEIKVSCNDQVLKITDAPVLASGGLNEVHVAFNFCEKWAGFIKTAIFYRNEEEAYYAVLDETDTCIVPWEVCYEEGTFYFGVFGEKDGIRRTSNVVRYKVKKGAITPDMKPSEPTPEVYDQIISIVSENKAVTEEFISDMEEKVESGYFNGKDGEDGYTPVRGVDYWTEEDQLNAELSFELLETITLEEETKSVIVNFNKTYKAVRVRITFPSQTTSVGYVYTKIIPPGFVNHGNMCGTDLPGGTLHVDHIRIASEVYPLAVFSSATSHGHEHATAMKLSYPVPGYLVYNEKDGFAGIEVDTYVNKLPAGTVIRIMGG